MSKHDYSAKRTDDRSDQMLSSEEFEPQKSGMGKEIKISLAAITILLGVLGYVLYNHFLGADGENGDLSVAAASSETETPGTGSADVSPTSGSSATAGSLSGMGTTGTTTNRWEGATGQDQTSTGKSNTTEPSSRFNYMPPPPVPKPAADPYAGYGRDSATETPANTWSSNAKSDTSPYSGQTNDPFDRRATQSTADGHVSERQIGGYPTQQQIGSRTYSDWESGSQSSAPGMAVVSSDTSITALTGAGQSSAFQSQAYQQGSSSDYATGGSSVSIQPMSQDRTENHGYVSSNTHGYTGGTDSAQMKSSASSQSNNTSSQGYNTSSQGYNTSSQGYSTSSQSSNPQVSAASSMDSTSAYSSQYGFSDEKATGGKYTIQPNDNYWIISTKRYGTGSYFKALEEHNRALFPDANQLGVNKEIETPDEAELVRLYPQLCPKPEHREASKHRMSVGGTVSTPAGATIYVVQEGDTLFDIARYELGKAARWAEIYKLNRQRLGKDFDYLTPGLELLMPSDGTQPDRPVGVMTQRSGARRQF